MSSTNVTEALILDSVARLGDLARKHARQNDLDQRYSDELWDAVKESGLALMCIPESQGGAGVSLELFCKATEVLASCPLYTSPSPRD